MAPLVPFAPALLGKLFYIFVGFVFKYISLYLFNSIKLKKKKETMQKIIKETNHL